jgi:tRNA threonylcarbamoyladenosine biosynthesis protein TsaB
MAVLAFDCCLRSISVAVLAGERLTVREEDAANGGQAERLMPLIEATMADAGIAYRDLTRLAVTLGPGGFTSVRVGIAAARGLALALGIAPVGQSSLEALAASAIARGLPPGTVQILVAVPAGRGGLYWQTFATDGGPLDQPRVIEAEAIGIERLLPGTALVGPGAAEVAAVYKDWLGPALTDVVPRADLLAHAAKDLTPRADLSPIYLRPADAKPQVGGALERSI